jgi:hypothetical protein
MANLIKEYENGRPWEKERLEKLAEQLKTEATYKNGVGMWNRSGNHLPIDVAEFAHYLGLPIDLNKHQKAYDEATSKFFAEYRKAQANRKPTAEELYEMKAAFGEGTTVVNVITGRKIKL